jgi:predicted nucleic acid-binding protein
MTAGGRPSPCRRRRGAQIAAIAPRHDATLATHNVKDVEGCGLRLVDPWT